MIIKNFFQNIFLLALIPIDHIEDHWQKMQFDRTERIAN